MSSHSGMFTCWSLIIQIYMISIIESIVKLGLTFKISLHLHSYSPVNQCSTCFRTVTWFEIDLVQNIPNCRLQNYLHCSLIYLCQIMNLGAFVERGALLERIHSLPAISMIATWVIGKGISLLLSLIRCRWQKSNQNLNVFFFVSKCFLLLARLESAKWLKRGLHGIWWISLGTFI